MRSEKDGIGLLAKLEYYIINGQSIFTVYRSLFVNGLLIFPLMTDVYFCYIN